jgi:lambda repressor-like predicted transcriptional regulator
MTSSKYTEDDIADAILAITEEGVSLVRAAQPYGVPKSTLSDCMKGQGAQAQQLQPNRRVSIEDEDRIKQWVLRQESLGSGLSYNQIRKGVESLLQQRGDNEPLGAN